MLEGSKAEETYWEGYSHLDSDNSNIQDRNLIFRLLDFTGLFKCLLWLECVKGLE